jgi:hypothetical protein
MIVPSLIVYHSWGGANPSTAHGIMIVHTCMAQACDVCHDSPYMYGPGV